MVYVLNSAQVGRLTLSNGIMGYLTTVYYLEKYPPKKGIVADIGSGPGRYALWIVERSYDVVAVNPAEST